MSKRLKRLGRDSVLVTDRGSARLLDRGSPIGGREWGNEKSVVEVKGWVKLCLRERGKIVPGSRREGHNIWTNTGREYLALLMSLSSGLTPFRSDSIAYIGLGTGSQVESTSVTALVSPVASDSGIFLVPFDVPPTFPLSPARTTVQYHRLFTESEVTLAPGTVLISEMGMFTNGSPTSSYTPGTRDTSLANAALQSPNAYKTFEPLGKTQALALDVSWQIRF
jgi:hypothetical protein